MPERMPTPNNNDADLEAAMAQATQAAYEQGVAAMKESAQTPDQIEAAGNAAAEALLREMSTQTGAPEGEKMATVLEFKPKAETAPASTESEEGFGELGRELGFRPMTPAEQAEAMKAQAERRAQG